MIALLFNDVKQSGPASSDIYIHVFCEQCMSNVVLDTLM